jgi:hypothetical protein
MKMKKKLLLNIVLIAAGLPSSWCQSYIFNEHGTTGNYYNGIIRSQYITYYETQYIGYFAYIPTLNGTFSSVKVPAGWRVKDFRVVNDTAYFCGTDLSNNTALLGHFCINNLLSGSGTVDFYRETGISSWMRILNRMAVYFNKKNNRLSVMAIGQTTNPDPEMSGADRVVYIPDYNSSQACLFENTPNEYFWDVASTDNFFALLGTTRIGGNTMTMRCVPTGTNAAGFTSAITNSRQYSCTLLFSSGIRATAFDLDYVAAASYHKKSTGSGWDYGMQIFTLHMPSMQMLYNQRYTMGTPSEPAFSLPPRDMANLPDSNALMVIDTHMCHPYYGVAKLNPYPTSSYCPVYYFYDNTNFTKLKSIAATTPGACMASGDAQWLKIDLNTLGYPAYSNNCIKSYRADFDIFTTYDNFQYDPGVVTLYNMSVQFVTNNNIEETNYDSGCN